MEEVVGPRPSTAAAPDTTKAIIGAKSARQFVKADVDGNLCRKRGLPCYISSPRRCYDWSSNYAQSTLEWLSHNPVYQGSSSGTLHGTR